jgi:hypothetical protein
MWYVFTLIAAVAVMVFVEKALVTSTPEAASLKHAMMIVVAVSTVVWAATERILKEIRKSKP